MASVPCDVSLFGLLVLASSAGPCRTALPQPCDGDEELGDESKSTPRVRRRRMQQHRRRLQRLWSSRPPWLWTGRGKVWDRRSLTEAMVHVRSRVKIGHTQVLKVVGYLDFMVRHCMSWGKPDH